MKRPRPWPAPWRQGPRTLRNLTSFYHPWTLTRLCFTSDIHRRTRAFGSAVLAVSHQEMQAFPCMGIWLPLRYLLRSPSSMKRIPFRAEGHRGGYHASEETRDEEHKILMDRRRRSKRSPGVLSWAIPPEGMGEGEKMIQDEIPRKALAWSLSPVHRQRKDP